MTSSLNSFNDGVYIGFSPGFSAYAPYRGLYGKLYMGVF